MSGAELLRRSGLAVSADARNAMGTLMCSIDGEGCAFPGEECFCACRTPGACQYWAYFQAQADGAWSYAAQGADQRRVVDGDMDAWVWVTSSSPAEVSLPPPIGLAEVCE